MRNGQPLAPSPRAKYATLSQGAFGRVTNNRVRVGKVKSNIIIFPASLLPQVDGLKEFGTHLPEGSWLVILPRNFKSFPSTGIYGSTL